MPIRMSANCPTPSDVHEVTLFAQRDILVPEFFALSNASPSFVMTNGMRHSRTTSPVTIKGESMEVSLYSRMLFASVFIKRTPPNMLKKVVTEKNRANFNGNLRFVYIILIIHVPKKLSRNQR